MKEKPSQRKENWAPKARERDPSQTPLECNRASSRARFSYLLCPLHFERLLHIYNVVLVDDAGFFFLSLKCPSLENYLKRCFLIDSPRRSAREVLCVSNPKKEEQYIGRTYHFLRVFDGFLGMRLEDKWGNNRFISPYNIRLNQTRALSRCLRCFSVQNLKVTEKRER